MIRGNAFSAWDRDRAARRHPASRSLQPASLATTARPAAARYSPSRPRAGRRATGARVNSSRCFTRTGIRMHPDPALDTMRPGNATEGDETLLVTLGRYPSVRAGVLAHGNLPSRAGRDRLSDRSALGGLAVAVDQLARTIAQLRTDRYPMVDATQVDTHIFFTLDCNRVIETQALDITAAARTTRISGDKVIEGTLFRTRSCKTNRYHFLLALNQRLVGPDQAAPRETAYSTQNSPTL